MAYVEPTLADFRIRFPEFAPVGDALVNVILAEAIPRVGDTWLERDRATAILYLTAHLLASEGEPARSAGGGVGGSTSGAVKRMKVGDVEVEYAGLGSGSGSGTTSEYASTVYGRRFLQLMRLNFPGVVAV